MIEEVLPGEEIIDIDMEIENPLNEAIPEISFHAMAGTTHP